MGNEINCAIKSGGKRAEGRALLETSEIIFRSAGLKLKIPFARMKSVRAAGGELRVETADEVTVFELGANAEKWAQRILYPKSRMEKLGVRAGSKVAVFGELESEFQAELTKTVPGFSRGKISADTEWVFLRADSEPALAQISKIAKTIKGAAAVWIIYPKGRKDITENGVLAAGRKAGLKDIKVVGFSPTHTALKFVIPVANR
jgi:hypothetical protein